MTSTRTYRRRVLPVVIMSLLLAGFLLFPGSLLTAGAAGGLVNPGFEDGTLGGDPLSWNVVARADSLVVRDFDGPEILTYRERNITVSPYKGALMLRMGSPKNIAEKQNVGNNTVSQTFTSSRSTLKFAFRLFSWEERLLDTFAFDLTKADGTRLSNLRVGDGATPAPTDPLSIQMPGVSGGIVTCSTLPCATAIDVGKQGDLLDTQWRVAEITGLPVGVSLKLTLTVGGTKNNAHATWAYFDNANTPPSATVSLNSTSPLTNDTITATVTSADIDNDPVTVTYVWRVNGTEKKRTSGSASLTDTYDLSLAGNGSKGDTITVEVTPNDGYDSGDAVSASATVVNSPPVAKFTYDPTDAGKRLEGNVLQLKDGSDDPDGDSIASWQWVVSWTIPSSGPGSSQCKSLVGGEKSLNSSSQNPFFIPPDQGIYGVSLAVTDGDGALNGVVSGGTASDGTPVPALAVLNSLPLVNALNVEAEAGMTVPLIGRFLDPGYLDNHTAVWSMNGVSPSATVQEDCALISGAVSGSVAGQSLTGTLTVTDSDGASRSDGFTMTVVPHAPGRHEPNGAISQAVPLNGDSIYLSYVQSAGDIDIFEVRLPDGAILPAGTEVLATLRGLPADYDLALISRSSSGSGGQGTLGNAMFGNAMFGNAMFGNAMFGNAMFGNTMFGNTMFGNAMFGNAMFGNAMFGNAMFGNAMFGNAMFGNTMFGNAMFGNAMFGNAMFGYYPLSQQAFTSLLGSEVGGTDIELSELTWGQVLTPDARVVGFSANLGLKNEAVLGRVDVPGTRLFAVVSGSNGAYSDQPYLLQLELSKPLDLQIALGPLCDGAPLVTPAVGQSVLRQDSAPKTLFVTQRERLQSVYGDAQWDPLRTKLEQLAGHDAVRGDIVSLASGIYDAWDTNPCSVDAANGVAEQIQTTIEGYLASHPTIQFVVLVGSDDVLPQRRVPDETVISNERLYLKSSFLRPGSPLFAAFANGFNLTDDYYVDNEPSAWQGREMYIPDLPIGRLTETPSEIMAAADAFLGSNGVLNPATALGTGYDFFIDGATVLADNLATKLTTTRLINDSWSAGELRCRLLGDDAVGLAGCIAPDVSSPNAHFTHYAALSAGGFGGANGLDSTDLMTSADVAGAPGLLGRIIFSMGCHAGLNVPDGSAAAADPGLGINSALDFVQAMAQQRAIFVASTGFGIGDDEGIGGTERLMGIFARLLVNGDTAAGSALVNAKYEYLSSLSAMTVYDEKSSIVATFYGLPMYRVLTGGGAAASAQSQGAGSTANLALTIEDGGSSTTTNHVFRQVTTGTGSYFTADGDAQATAARAVQPRIVVPIVADAARGPVRNILVTATGYTDIAGLDPVIARPTNEWEVDPLEPQVCFASYWPSELATINSLDVAGGLFQTLVVTPGQFRCTSGGAATVTGTQRLYTGLTVELLRAPLTVTDVQPPVVGSVDLRPITNGVSVTVSASDPGGIARVIVQRNSNGTVTTSELVLNAPLPTAGPFTVNVSGYAEGDTLVIRVIDGAGNVTSVTGKGASISLIPVAVVPEATVDENSPVELRATVSNFASLEGPVSYIWEFGDGAFVSGQTLDGTIVVQHTYTDDNPTGTAADAYTATVKVTDAAGGVGLADIVVTVRDVAPVAVILSATSPIDENGTSNLVGSFSDVGLLDSHTVMVDWGDGSTSPAVVTQGAGSGTFTASHRYLDDNPTGTPADDYTIKVSVADDDSVVGTATVVVRVNNVAPTADAGADQTVSEGQVVPVSATFNDLGTKDTHTATINWGDGTAVEAGVVTQNAGVVSGSHVYADNGVYTVTVTVTDDDGGSVADSLLVTVNNVAPTANDGADQTANEGQVVTLSATFNDLGTKDTHTATVDWGDGTAVEAGVVAETPFGPPGSTAGANGTVSRSHVYADNGAYTVTVTVTDDDGGSVADSLLVTVNNVAPTANAGADQTVNEGQVVTLSATFNDLGTKDTHTATVDWGDGTAVEAGVVAETPFGPPGSTAGASGTVSRSHVYADNGVYTVTVTVTDDDGGSVADSLLVTVNNVAPTANAGADQTANEGQVVTLSATFNDLGTKDTHTATVDWGDGTAVEAGVVAETPFGPPGSTAGANGTVSRSHVYADNGAYTVTVTVTDDDGGSVSDTLVVTVNNVAPTANAGADQTVNEGQVVTLSATFNDLGTNDTHTATIDWGDGTAVEGGVVAETPFGPPGSTAGANGTVSRSHVYADNGAYTVTVTVTDDDGGSVSDSLLATVNNVAPTANAGADQTANEGQVVTVSATFNDPGTKDTHTATVDWGDGTAVEGGVVAETPFGPPGSTAGASGTVSRSHVYADNGAYTVTLTVTDDDGGSVSDSLVVTVNNVAPTVNAGADRTANAGQSVSLSVSFSDLGTKDTHTATIDWGDGAAVEAGVVAETPFGPPGSTAGASGTVSGSHLFTVIGTHNVTITVTDDDGGTVSDTVAITALCADAAGDVAAGVGADGDIVGCTFSNTSTTMTITITVAGTIVPGNFQYRVGLDTGTLDGVRDVHLRWDGSRATGLASVQGSSAGNTVTLTFNLADITTTSGGQIQFYLETQAGVPGAPEVGKVDSIPDGGGWFRYVVS